MHKYTVYSGIRHGAVSRRHGGHGGHAGARAVRARVLARTRRAVPHARGTGGAGGTGGAPLVMILVKSAPRNRARRQLIRDSWKPPPSARVGFGFVVGRPALPGELPLLRLEDDRHRDLIIGNSVDTYRNLTLKAVSVLEWVTRYCGRARLLLRSDDDFFVNVPRVLRWARGLGAARNAMFGAVLRGRPPYRDRRSKWFVSRETYNGSVYPDFVEGEVIAVTLDAARALLAAAGAHSALLVEDVLFGGILARELNITVRPLPVLKQGMPCRAPAAMAALLAVRAACLPAAACGGGAGGRGGGVPPAFQLHCAAVLNKQRFRKVERKIPFLQMLHKIKSSIVGYFQRL
ncbi:unnamed protein product [Plutella xylostella]|uniref:Hexosyltransferase n=1 Tax=Plutella xylostella TaxID=51655 RepID=A0A8S4FUU7_PLUXY|nr:unnamed protein product [Plutella xylostella]